MLLSVSITSRRDKTILYTRVAMSLIIISSLFAYNTFYLSVLASGIGLYSGLFHVTSNTQVFNMFLCLLCTIILGLTAFYPRKVWVKDLSLSHRLRYVFIYYKTKIIGKMGEQFRIIEYPIIILFVLIGAFFLISTSDLVSIFLSIELQSYGLYIISAIYRDSELATSGGLTYFLLGGLSSCFILLSTSLLYANSGSTNLESLYIITSIYDIPNLVFSENADLLYWYKPYFIHLSLIIMAVGFLFKVSAAPFHFWSPDVYDAIPTIVTAFVAIIAKISIFIFLLELVYFTSKSFFNFSWTTSLLLSSLLSLIIGSVLGLTQFRIKRLYAYSTISHVGFVILALSINSVESIQSFFFYLMQYSVSNLNAFIILIAIGFSLYNYTNKNKEYLNLQDKNNSPIQLISQIKGYFYINSILALSLTITLFSFAGIPPLLGFFAKMMILSAALDKGYIFMVLIAIITSVISTVYYLAVIKDMYFSKPENLLINTEYLLNTEFSYTNIDKEEKVQDQESENITTNDENKRANVENRAKLENIVNSYNFYRYIVLEKHNTDIKLEKHNIIDLSPVAREHKETKIPFDSENIVLSSSLTITVSILTLVILLFILRPNEWLSMANILALTTFNL